MSTTTEFIEYASSQAAGCGQVRYKKMFGEYMVYVDEKPILLVCDNTVYVKMLTCIEALMTDADRGCPYQGAKEHYILDMDYRELAHAVIKELVAMTPLPKPRKKKQKKEEGRTP